MVSKKEKILCFGELLLRFSPQLNGEWLRTNSMPFFVGGAELNVASALANWGLDVGYSTALPENALSSEIVRFLTQKNIDTSAIIYQGNRIGAYYLPQGADLKNSGVIYDRMGSAFADLKIGMIDWATVLEGVSWLHLSAITPALGSSLADLCLEAVKEASKRKITVSIDLNYRSKLWKYGKHPHQIMPQLLDYCDIVMGNIWAANALLDVEISETARLNEVEKDGYLTQSQATAKAMQVRFPKCKIVANTFRFDTPTAGIHYYTALHEGEKAFVSPEYNINKVVDKVGSGDCFMAGLIYGIHHKHHPQQVLDFATKAAVGKLQEIGDATRQTVAKISQTL